MSRFCRFSTHQKPIIRISKITQQVPSTQEPAEDCVSQDRIQQRTVEQVVGMHDQHDQHDVHTVKMEQSKIIKNTVQRKNLIIQEKIHQLRCKAKFAAFKPSRNRGRATRVEDVSVDTQRSVSTKQKVQNSKVVNSVKISQVQSMDEIVKDPSDHAEAGADDAEDADRTKRNTGIPCVFQQTQSTMRRLTMNSREQHPRKRCQMR